MNRREAELLAAHAQALNELKRSHVLAGPLARLLELLKQLGCAAVRFDAAFDRGALAREADKAANLGLLENGEEVPELSSLFPHTRMTQRTSVKARSVLNALYRLDSEIKRKTGGSHKVLHRSGFLHFMFAFYNREEIGPWMLARISKHTGLSPEDLLPYSRASALKFQFILNQANGYRC